MYSVWIVVDVGVAQLAQQLVGQFVVGVGDDFAGVAVDDVLRQHAADQVVFRHRDVLDAGGFDRRARAWR